MIEQFNYNDIITFTDNAIKKLNELAGDDSIEIKFGIEPSGCSGYSYVWDIFKKAEKNENEYIKIEATKKASIFINKRALQYLKNIKIDYIKEGLQENFIFKNPNVTKECGCGESFNID